jgi:hypothetical protein
VNTPTYLGTSFGTFDIKFLDNSGTEINYCTGNSISGTTLTPGTITLITLTPPSIGLHSVGNEITLQFKLATTLYSPDDYLLLSLSNFESVIDGIVEGISQFTFKS